MTAKSDDESFERLARTIYAHSNLLRTWALEGGISARVIALEIERSDGRTEKLIVRRHGDEDLRHNPNIAADEFSLLQVLRVEGMAAPAPVHFDQSGEILPTPFVVVEYIEGDTEFAPADLADLLVQLATQLLRIHGLHGARHDLSFLPGQSERCAKRLAERPTTVDESVFEGQIRDTLGAAWPLSQRNRSGLLHGDFWPGNVLWNNGKLVAVIDWEDAALGDPLADLANARLEILWAFGRDAMDAFTKDYQSNATIDFTHLPYWDLCAALRPISKFSEWADDDIAEQAMRKAHRSFVTQAFDALSASSGNDV